MLKKRLIAIISATFLAAMNFTTVFANTTGAEVGAVEIAPYDSNILLNAQEGVWEYLYTVDRPLLFPKPVQITNHYTNPDNIIVQQFTPAGAPIGQQLSLPAGGTGILLVNPSLISGNVDLRVLADTTGVYRVGVSEGDINGNLYTFELEDNIWTNALEFEAELMNEYEILIANSEFSADSATIRIIGFETVGNSVTIAPGETIVIASTAVAQDILLQVQATPGNSGTYHFNISMQ